MQLQVGQRVPLANLIGEQFDFEIEVDFKATFPLDVSAFGVTADNKLFHDDFMTFFNQPIAPNGVVEFSQQQTKNIFKFHLGKHQVPQVEKFIICATVDHPTASMRDIQSGTVDLLLNGQQKARFNIQPELFAAEKAVMLLQVYQSSGTWRVGVVSQGFNGGLAALVQYFGGEVDESAIAAPVTESVPAISKVDLKKKLVLDKVANASPQLLDLTKKSLISLEKKNLLGVKARVGLVLDRSGSMHGQYKRGDVQKVIDRILPLAINFDDDGAFECWAFGQRNVRLDDVTLNNVKGYVESTQGGWKKWNIGAAINYEPDAIEDVIRHYGQFNDGIPTYIVFISDGGVHENRKITRLISDSAKLPIFWQFVGIGGSNYGILEKLDDMTGRVVDNCNFFALDNIQQFSDEHLYDLLLEEFPLWIQAATQKNILRG